MGGNKTSLGEGVKQIPSAAHTAGCVSWMPVFRENLKKKQKKQRHVNRKVHSSFFVLLTIASIGTNLQQAGAGAQVFKMLLC